jgi:hypothetical protein
VTRGMKPLCHAPTNPEGFRRFRAISAGLDARSKTPLLWLVIKLVCKG